jgi:hypothetical protein
MADLTVPELAATQLSYHLRMAAGFAAASDVRECASEAVLAWTILSLYESVHADAGDLPGIRVAGVSDAQWDSALRRAQALALELQAHFVSEGQYATAEIYEAVGRAVPGAVIWLRGRS